MSGRVVPDNFADVQEWYMTVVLAAGMFQVWKFGRNNWKDVYDFIKKAKVSVSVADDTGPEDKYGK